MDLEKRMQTIGRIKLSRELAGYILVHNGPEILDLINQEDISATKVIRELGLEKIYCEDGNGFGTLVSYETLRKSVGEVLYGGPAHPRLPAFEGLAKDPNLVKENAMKRWGSQTFDKISQEKREEIQRKSLEGRGLIPWIQKSDLPETDGRPGEVERAYQLTQDESCKYQRKFTGKKTNYLLIAAKLVYEYPEVGRMRTPKAVQVAVGKYRRGLKEENKD